MKVLIVDRDWRFVQQASDYLESKAHLVVHQPGADEALAQASHWKPDLVFLSAEAARDGLLESLRQGKDRPAVVLTGRLDEYHLVWQAWQKGGDEVLIKPLLRPQELHLAVVTALENAAAGTRGAHRKTRASA